MTQIPDLISERQAALVLANVGVPRRQARRVLAAGVAGAPLTTAGAKLFERERVHELASWPTIDGAYLDQACPHGYFVARRAGGHEPADLAGCGPAGGWDVTWLGGAWLEIHVARTGSLPLIATVSGFVVRGADIVGVECDDRDIRFDLAEPGPWWRQLERRRFCTGPGRDYVVRLPGWSPRPLAYA